MNYRLFKKYYLFIISLFISHVGISENMKDMSLPSLSFTTDISEAKYSLSIEYEVTYKGQSVKRTHDLYLSHASKDVYNFSDIQAFSRGTLLFNKLHIALCSISKINKQNIIFLIQYAEIANLDKVNKSEEDKIIPLYETEFLVPYNMNGTTEYLSDDGLISFKFIFKWKTLK